MVTSPKPVRHDEHGPEPLPLGELPRWGTKMQRKYARERVRRDVIAVLHQVHAAQRQVAPADLDMLSPELRQLFDKLVYLREHVPFLLCGTVTRREQWAVLEAQLPSEDSAQTSLPFSPERTPD